MGFDFLTRFIVGRGAAEKSERKKLEKKYAHVEDDLERVKEVAPEISVPVPSSSASSIRSRRSSSSYLEPLQPRIAREGSIRASRPALERSHSDLCSRAYKPPSCFSTYGADPTALDFSAEHIRRNYSENNVWDQGIHGKMPPMPQLQGVGRHRMSIDADEEHQMSHLRRTMSDLTDQMVCNLGDFKLVGTKPEVWEKYQKQRAESMESSASSRSSSNPMSQREYFDPKRGCNVVKGFAPSFISSGSSSTEDGSIKNYRKDSTASVASSNSEGEARHHRRKTRQASLPISDNSGPSPLTTIAENPDAVKQPPRKLERPCKFEDSGNTDSALASSEEDAWVPELQVAGLSSHLTRQISRAAKNTDQNQLQLVRTRSSEAEKPRRGLKAVVDRSRGIKHPVKHVVRQAHHQKRPKPTATERPKTDQKSKQDNPRISKDGERPVSRVIEDASRPSAETSGGSEEANEHPSDLARYIHTAKGKNSSKTLRNKSRESEDDGSSINSSLTTKTLVPLVSRLAGALPQAVHGRQRSATAFRNPMTTTTCQPATKAEGAKPEASHATAH